MLQSLRKMAGTKASEVLVQIVDSYCEEAPQLLQAMRAAAIAKDAAALRQAAHTLRAASANLGAIALSQLCQNLEAMGSAGSVAGALEDVLRAEVLYKTVKVALQMECQRG